MDQLGLSPAKMDAQGSLAKQLQGNARTFDFAGSVARMDMS